MDDKDKLISVQIPAPNNVVNAEVFNPSTNTEVHGRLKAGLTVSVLFASQRFEAKITRACNDTGSARADVSPDGYFLLRRGGDGCWHVDQAHGLFISRGALSVSMSMATFNDIRAKWGEDETGLGGY